MRAIGINFGYTMPAKWEPHEGTWLQWPGCGSTRPRDGAFLGKLGGHEAEAVDCWTRALFQNFDSHD
jgi:hypothetical protein